LPRILRDDVRYGAGQECIRGTAPELEVGRGPDSQRVPIDRPSTRGPGPEFVERRLALPEESEGKAGAGRPFAEEDLRRLDGLELLQEFVMPAELPHGVEQGRMGPGPALREPPQVALANRLTDLADRPEASMQIVLCEEGLLGRDLLHGMRGAHGTQATAFSDIARATGAIGEEHASVAGILRVRGGVEEIAPQEGRDREDQRMARAEEMDGCRRVQALLRGNDDADEIPESVCLQERHDSSDRAYRDVEGGHQS